MSNPTDPRKDYAHTYFVQDRSNQDERNRLQVQDQMLTAAMGGVLAEQDDITHFTRILDVGCGAGNWLIETAKQYPHIQQLIGVDASRKMVEYARAQAEEQGVSDRVQFQVMDALLVLEFPDAFFDLVNQRFCFSFLRTWEWPKLLHEYQRITRPGGVIRITEPDIVGRGNSPAMARIGQIQMQAFFQAGHLFKPEGSGVSNELADLLRRYSLQNVQVRTYCMEYRTGTLQGDRFYEDMKLLFKTALPFYRKWTQVPDDYEELYQQALREIQHPDFVATVDLLTAWGTNPHH